MSAIYALTALAALWLIIMAVRLKLVGVAPNAGPTASALVAIAIWMIVLVFG